MNEDTWMLIGSIAEQMGDVERSLNAYEHALRHNPDSVAAHLRVASIARSRDDFVRAIEHWQAVLHIERENGEVWSALGHCYLMQDDLQKAYAAYQQALYFLPNPKDPKLWYGIGILYDRYGSLEHAEEAFSSVLRMDPDFDKADEIYFRLGIIYKQQQKYVESLDCFDRILRNPPNPLANLDIWFQIGHVYEQQKDYTHAKEAYERVLHESPHHAKVLQQLGWLYHQSGSSFTNQEMAIQYLTKSLESDGSDAQSWYLLGRAYMAGQKYQKAYEAYQQAVYRDGRNPTFWCSIGVLYYNINQYRDALDAYSRAIRINPYISEVWFDLGSLYESCNNQIHDAIDAYARALDLDPNNPLIKQRLSLLRNVQANGGSIPAAPGPQDVHPTAYATAHGPPNVIGGGPNTSSSGGPPPSARGPLSPHDPRSSGDLPAMNGRDLPVLAPPPSHPHHGQPGDGHRMEGPEQPFRPPPLNLDERSRGGGHGTLAPMNVDERYANGGTPGSSHGPPPPPPPPPHVAGGGPAQGSVLLHHPQPQSQPPSGPSPSHPPTLPSMQHPPTPYDHQGPPPPPHVSSRYGTPPPPSSMPPQSHTRGGSPPPRGGRHHESRSPPGFTPYASNGRPYHGPPPGPVPPHGGEDSWDRDRDRRDRVERERYPGRERGMDIDRDRRMDIDREREREVARERDREREMRERERRDPRAMDTSPVHSPRSHAGSTSSATGPPPTSGPHHPPYHPSPRAAPYDARRGMTPPPPGSQGPPPPHAQQPMDNGRYKPHWDHQVPVGQGGRSDRPPSTRYDPRHDVEPSPPYPHHPPQHGPPPHHASVPPHPPSPDPHRRPPRMSMEGPPPPPPQPPQLPPPAITAPMPVPLGAVPNSSGPETRWREQTESPRPGSTRPPANANGETGPKRKRGAAAGGAGSNAGGPAEKTDRKERRKGPASKKLKEEGSMGGMSGKDRSPLNLMYRTGPSELLKDSPPDGPPPPAPPAPGSGRGGRRKNGGNRPSPGSPIPSSLPIPDTRDATGTRVVDEDYDGDAADALMGLSGAGGGYRGTTSMPPPSHDMSPERGLSNGHGKSGGASSRRSSGAVHPVSRETDSPHPPTRSPTSAHSSSHRDLSPPHQSSTSGPGGRRLSSASSPSQVQGSSGPPPPSSTSSRPGPPTRVASIHELTSQGPPTSPSRQTGQVNVVKRMRSSSPSDSDASSKKARTEGDRMDVSPSPTQPQPRSPGTRYEPTKEFGGRPMDEHRSPSNNSPKGVNGTSHGSPTNPRPSLSSNSSHNSKSEAMNLPPIATLSHSPSRGSTPRGQSSSHARSGSDMMVEDEDDERGRRGSSGGRSDQGVDKGPSSSPKALKAEGRE